MITKTLTEKQEDMVDEAVSALENLIPTPETIWGDISEDKLEAADDDTMREICRLSYNDFNRFQQAVEPATRRMDMVLFVRAVVFKAEASKIEGFLNSEFVVAKIDIANNAAAPDIALNAAVYRLLTRLDNARPDDKYRVSRNAKAMKGIEISATKAGVPIRLATAGKILRMIERSSRSDLCKLVDEHAKLDKENAVEESAASQVDESQDQQPTSETGAASEGDDESAEVEEEAANETAKLVIEPPPLVPELAAEREFPAPLDPETVDAVPENDLHLVAVVWDGHKLVLKGVVCSGDKARTLIQKAMAG